MTPHQVETFGIPFLLLCGIYTAKHSIAFGPGNRCPLPSLQFGPARRQPGPVPRALTVPRRSPAPALTPARSSAWFGTRAGVGPGPGGPGLPSTVPDRTASASSDSEPGPAGRSRWTVNHHGRRSESGQPGSGLGRHPSPGPGHRGTMSLPVSLSLGVPARRRAGPGVLRAGTGIEETRCSSGHG